MQQYYPNNAAMQQRNNKTDHIQATDICSTLSTVFAFAVKRYQDKRDIHKDHSEIEL